MNRTLADQMRACGDRSLRSYREGFGGAGDIHSAGYIIFVSFRGGPFFATLCVLFDGRPIHMFTEFLFLFLLHWGSVLPSRNPDVCLLVHSYCNHCIDSFLENVFGITRLEKDGLIRGNH